MEFKIMQPVHVELSAAAKEHIEKIFRIGGNREFGIQDALEWGEEGTPVDAELTRIRQAYGEIIFRLKID